ncbi:MAG: hypothetical protein KID00_06235 [Clostridium argentinense]|uniref:Uncharacterized protein n=1 Tax=Clostridium faecium TaxID=2762223 RepID=A0ABR8YW38_9CLOT|nr:MULTISPECIES: hypothetical protein [Clostridium]MBD8048445.1 hypothetical protein [Clostridium faecium]MBS5823447.1 hypothetical protein [Clostridium argentinense]MDU1348568.1 hypothetical protein [Clostridium argentinense]
MGFKKKYCKLKKCKKTSSDFLEKAFLITLGVIVGLLLLKSIGRILIFLLMIAAPVVVIVITVKKYKH